MSSNGSSVGIRIRSLRKSRGLSLRELADRCGLSFNGISRIERGENSPTVTTLHRLAQAFGIAVGDFFPSETPQTSVLVRSGEGPDARLDGALAESLGRGLAGQQIRPFRITLQPGQDVSRPSLDCPGEDFAHCLEGRVEGQVGERQYTLTSGDSLLVALSEQHSYRNVSGMPATLLLVTPSTNGHPEPISSSPSPGSATDESDAPPHERAGGSVPARSAIV